LTGLNYYGLEQTIYDNTLGYARVKNLDQPAAASEVLRGLQSYLASREGTRLSDQQRAAIEAEINSIRAAGSGAQQVQSLFMAPGTEAYDKYAKHDQLVRAISDIQQSAEINKAANLAASRRMQISTEPVVKTKYRNQSKNIVDDVQAELASIQRGVRDLRINSAGMAAETFNIVQQRNEALYKIHQRLSAVRNAEISAGGTFTGGDMLDLLDSVEAQMNKMMDTQEAAKVLAADLPSEGDETVSVMTELMAQARKRRLAKAAGDRIDLHAVARVDEAYGRVSGLKVRTNQALRDAGMATLPTNIADVTADQAQEVINQARIMRKGPLGAGLTDTQRQDMQMLSEMMSRITGKDSTARLRSYEGASSEAEQAFRYYFQGSRHIQEAEETAARLAADGLLAPADVPTAAVDAATRAASSAARPSVAQTGYKRFRDSIRSGAAGDALKNPIVKRGLIAAAALSAFGFIYSARKDHAQADVTGPPLMPGGNPYEEGLPTPGPSMLEGFNMANPITRGMQYKIYTSGSTDDTERLSSMLNGVVDGPINSTMYNSLPRLGQDPYSQVASNF
jgi:hypothetical protein